MGGGDSGGDGGASERAAADRERKSKASADINRLFGQDSGSGTAMPIEDQFAHADIKRGRVVDWDAYNKAVADWKAAQAASAAQAGPNMSAREKLYGDTRAASFDLNKTKLDQDRETSSRELKFALARSGLFGGSTDVDQHALEQRAYDRGTLDIGTMADTGVADLRSQDEQSRLGLLSQVNAGLDAGSALSSARDQLSINADRANAAARGNTIANLFNNIGLLYDRQNQGAGVLAARGLYPYGGGGATFSTPGSSGTVVR